MKIPDLNKIYDAALTYMRENLPKGDESHEQFRAKCWAAATLDTLKIPHNLKFKDETIIEPLE